MMRFTYFAEPSPSTEPPAQPTTQSPEDEGNFLAKIDRDYIKTCLGRLHGATSSGTKVRTIILK